MKLNKKIRIFIIVAVIVLMAIAGLVLAESKTKTATDNKVVTRENSTIYFEQVGNDPSKIDVYLGMHDTASIASFQVGLEIDIADCYDSTFDWTTGDLDLNDTLHEARISEQKKDDVTGNLVENLNLYYVGTKELNELTETEDIDHIKLGTINIVPEKDENDNDVPVRSSFVAIQTREDFSKTVSLSHEPESIKVDLDATYSGKIIVKEAPTVDNLTANVEAVVAGDVNEGETVEGSKVVVNFELKDDTNSLTALEVRLVDENGDEKYTKTINIENLENEIPVSFVKVAEGKYKVQIIGSYTLDNGETITNEILKTSTGATAESLLVEVVHTDEPNNPEQGGQDNPSDQNNPSSQNKPSGQNKPSNQGSSSKPNNSSNSSNKSDSSNSSNSNGKLDNTAIGSKIIEAIKTGANHSATWLIITLIVLVIVAVGIFVLRKNLIKKSKH